MCSATYLPTWQCPRPPAAAATIDRYLLPTGPTAANSRHDAAVGEWDRRTDGQTDEETDGHGTVL